MPYDVITGLPQLWDSYSQSIFPTPYEVRCAQHGDVYLTAQEYVRQRELPEDPFRCPICREPSRFNERRFVLHITKAEN